MKEKTENKIIKIMVVLVMFVFWCTVFKLYATETSIILEFNRIHSVNNELYNNDNSLTGLELKEDKNSISVYTMKNSFFNRSYGVNYNRYIYDNDKIAIFLGAGIATGYKTEIKTIKNNGAMVLYETPCKFGLSDDITLEFHGGCEIKLTKNISIINLISGNCLDSQIKIKF